MISGDQVQTLKSENELLRIQLRDLDELISAREEELDWLRKKADQAAQLQSRLENTLLEMDFLQGELGRQQQVVFGAMKREAGLENEVIQGIGMEKAYYEIRDQLNSSRAEVSRLQQEALEVKRLNQLVAELHTRIASLESQVDLMELDQGFLKEELDEWRKKGQPEGSHQQG